MTQYSADLRAGMQNILTYIKERSHAYFQYTYS